jgi:hypothetical protein
LFRALVAPADGAPEFSRELQQAGTRGNDKRYVYVLMSQLAQLAHALISTF